MKITQEKKFSPISITLEEIDDFYALESILAFYDAERDPDGGTNSEELCEKLREYFLAHHPRGKQYSPIKQ